MLVYVPGAILGLALALFLTTALPRRRALRDVLEAPYRTPETRPLQKDEHGRLTRLGRSAVPTLTRLGLPRPARLRDLRTLERTPSEHLATQAASTLVFALLSITYPLALRAAGITLPVQVVLGTTVLGACLGFLLPDRKLRTDAEHVREHLRHATSAFLDLTAIMLAAGAGLEESMICAAEPGIGPGHDQLRTALAVAQTNRKPLWDTLGHLGEHTDVTDLCELAACATLAGTEGARIRATLTTKATSLRTRLLAEQEAHAASATERAAIPTTLLMAGYMLLVTFPAVIQAVHSL